MGVFGSIVTAGAVMRSRTSMADPPCRMLGFTLLRAQRRGHRAQALFGGQQRLKWPEEPRKSLCGRAARALRLTRHAPRTPGPGRRGAPSRELWPRLDA